jgi:hypothetical protein
MTYIPPSTTPFSLNRLTALDNNHIHAWELIETSGSTFADTGSSTTKVNMTIANTANLQLNSQGIFGACPVWGLQASGTSGNASASALVSSFTDLPTTTMTFESWVSQAQISGGGAVFAVSCDFTNAINFQFGINTTAADNYYITFRTANNFGNGTTGTTSAIGSATHNVSSWVYLAVTYDGSNFRYYVNGDLLNTQAATGAIQWANTNGPAPTIYIGSQNTGNNFFGKISRVRLSNIVRTQSYLQGVYKQAMAYV